MMRWAISVLKLACLIGVVGVLLLPGVLFSAESPVPPAPGGADYIIGAGDQLDINVWKDEVLTRTVVVRPDGKISFPLVGQLTAAGKTVEALKKEMEEKLIPYIPEPVLFLDVKQVNSMDVYVIGRVNTPNRFFLNKHVNVLQAIAMAGGFNPFAKRNSIRIFRNEGGKTTVYKFRYDDVADGDNLQQNIELKRGDVIVVP